MSNETDSFIQEVDQGLREDQVQKFVRKYWVHALFVFVVFVGGIAGWQGWKAMQTSAARAQADAYVAAQELAQAGNLDDAKNAFETLSNEGPQSYRVMARMERAAVLEVQGDLAGAVAAFDEAAEAASDPLMRNTARLRAAYIVAETQDFAAVQARVQPLIDDGGNIGVLAQELLAIEAWEAGQTDLARSTFESISLAFDAPESVRQRAQLAIGVIGPAPAAPAAPASGAAPAATPQATTPGENE